MYKQNVSKDLEPLIDNFLKNRKTDLVELLDIIYDKQDVAQERIHALKGVTGSYGFDDAYRYCQEIENYIKDKKMVTARELAFKLLDYFENLDVVYVDEEF